MKNQSLEVFHAWRVPVFVPNDIMSMLNHEYPRGTKSHYYDGYYYVPLLRLWLQESKF